MNGITAWPNNTTPIGGGFVDLSGARNAPQPQANEPDMAYQRQEAYRLSREKAFDRDINPYALGAPDPWAEVHGDMLDAFAYALPAIANKRPGDFMAEQLEAYRLLRAGPLAPIGGAGSIVEIFSSFPGKAIWPKIG